MKMRWYLRAATLLLASMAAMVTVSAAAEAGSAGDPLVTLSYLNETYLPKILAQVQQRASGSGGGTASAFSVVELTKGQALTAGVGCEVMLRGGSAACVAAGSPGLIDQTTGATLENGKALEKNHLYMATIDGRGVTAADTVVLLVRGSYTVA